MSPFLSVKTVQLTLISVYRCRLIIGKQYHARPWITSILIHWHNPVVFYSACILNTYVISSGRNLLWHGHRFRVFQWSLCIIFEVFCINAYRNRKWDRKRKQHRIDCKCKTLRRRYSYVTVRLWTLFGL